jgi:hypothetical protein
MRPCWFETESDQRPLHPYVYVKKASEKRTLKFLHGCDKIVATYKALTQACNLAGADHRLWLLILWPRDAILIAQPIGGLTLLVAVRGWESPFYLAWAKE